MPGFVDVHIHAAQCMNAGLGVLGHEKELRECLKKYTVASEVNFRDPSLAKACYSDIVV
jgi:cytosine/adenosine deaminase-related metal-dependent hydrolase